MIIIFMPKTLSDKYLYQLVNLYTRILDKGEDLDHLLSTNKEQYSIDMDRKKIMSESSWKQHKVKLRALRKHSDSIEQEYINRGKGQYSTWNKKSLRDYTTTFLQFKPYPKETKKVKQPKPKPSKYKIPIPKGKGNYGVAEIYDVNNDFSYWIKYNSKKDFDDKLGKLKSDSIEGKFNVIPHGLRDYVSFVDEQFQDILDGIGVSK